jgi:hypothetical protein
MSLIESIKQTDLSQDIQLAAAISDLKRNPASLTTFLSDQQNKVFNTITQQKDDTFNMVYGDLTRSKEVQTAVLNHNLKSREILRLHDNILVNQEDTANSIVQNKNTFGRKYEMNEWSVNNKKDTLFVFSSLFITIGLFLLLTALLRLRYISAGVWGFTGAIGLVIFIMIVVNRAQYTDNLRDNKYWNKKRFEGNYGKIPVPSVCPTTVNGSSLASRAAGAVGSAASAVGSAASVSNVVRQ